MKLVQSLVLSLVVAAIAAPAFAAGDSKEKKKMEEAAALTQAEYNASDAEKEEVK